MRRVAADNSACADAVLQAPPLITDCYAQDSKTAGLNVIQIYQLHLKAGRRWQFHLRRCGASSSAFNNAIAMLRMAKRQIQRKI